MMIASYKTFVRAQVLRKYHLFLINTGMSLYFQNMRERGIDGYRVRLLSGAHLAALLAGHWAALGNWHLNNNNNVIIINIIIITGTFSQVSTEESVRQWWVGTL